MTKCRLAATLLAVALSSAALPAGGLAADVCQNPTFRIARGSPFSLLPKPGVDSQPTALSAGTYIVRPGAQPGAGCGCDLAVGLMSKSLPHQNFLALLRGNDDGTFSGSPDTLRQLNGTPVAIATGRFRQDLAVEVIVVVTSTGSGNGQVQVFVPDSTGAYPKTPTATFPVGPNPAAITKGDFDGDGNLDVAVANLNNSSLTILFGDGTGSFVPNAVTVSDLGVVPKSLTVGRFSGTAGADDIAIGVLQNASGATQVGFMIVPGSSTRQFAPKPVVTVGAPGSSEPFIAAANLTGSSQGAQDRPWRDLAIAFTDGDAVGRIKVLLGSDAGSFDVNAAQTLDIGPTQPRSIKVVDLDDDGVVDLMVSAYTQPSQRDGTIHFFQGHAAPAANVGFQANKRWFTIPATTNILPRALVAGRFGNQGATVGIAAINAPDIDSISVFLGNGQGAFTEPSLITTPVGDDDQLFVAGDFHSGDGKSALQDLAFITKLNGNKVLRILQANGAGGFAPPDPGQLPVLAGDTPSLMVAGQFVPNTATSVAIVDASGGVGQQPVLKIFFGQGNGLMTEGTELALTDTGRPTAMTTGHFRGPGAPLDIALVGDTTPAGSTAFSGKLTLLINDGQGGFTVGARQPLAFVPSAIVSSSRLRPGGKTDLLIRDAKANRFLFLVNITNIAAGPVGSSPSFRLAVGPNQGFFDGAGAYNALLVGNVAHTGSNVLDDVVTFDYDMTLKIFVNNGLESFNNPHAIAPGNDPRFAGAQPPYLLADFGSGTLALAAPVVRAGQLSLLLLKGDGAGGFAPASGQVPLEAVRGVGTTTVKTNITLSSEPASHADIQLGQTVAAQFRSALHGNGKPDFAFFTKSSEFVSTSGNCPGDNTPLPQPVRKLHAMACPDKVTDPFKCDGRAPCYLGDCCRCTDFRIPKQNRCPGKCDFPDQIISYEAFCERTSTFAPVLTVFANTCGD